MIEDWTGPISISVYCPPKYTITSEQFFTILEERFIAVDDYNVKDQFWESRLVNPKGRVLYKTIINKRLNTISQSMPTYWSTDRKKVPDIIDFGIIKGIAKAYFRIKPSLELFSDHSPLIITVSSKITRKMQSCVLHNRRTNWQYFREQVETTINTQIVV